MTPGPAVQASSGGGVFLVVLGTFQVIAATLLGLFSAGLVLALAAYSGAGHGVLLLALLFVVWGWVSGRRLIARRTISACRSAAFWYLPVVLLLFAVSVFGLRRSPEQAIVYFGVAIVPLAIFAMMAVPLLPRAWFRPDE
jgi:hypothetical protein